MTCVSTTIPAADQASECPPPAWVGALFSRAAIERDEARNAVSITRRTHGHFRLVTAHLHGAAHLDDDDFRRRTTDCYTAVGSSLDGFTPARLWNHIPNIHSPAGADLDRYMLFNSGRYDAFLSWYGDAARWGAQLATASGIGHHGADLIIHCLATDRPIHAIDNPRQIAPHRYSARFGPQPPCFARATRIDNLLLVGGTASVRGEDTMHLHDLAAQTQETFTNLDALLSAADCNAARNSFRELRVYHPRRSDTDAIMRSLRAAFPALPRLELMQADLCRRELLIEIEGLAEF
jgi:chorismate lyase / 3-hydroxybenzoate synthase